MRLERRQVVQEQAQSSFGAIGVGDSEQYDGRADGAPRREQSAEVRIGGNHDAFFLGCKVEDPLVRSVSKSQ